MQANDTQSLKEAIAKSDNDKAATALEQDDKDKVRLERMLAGIKKMMDSESSPNNDTASPNINSPDDVAVQVALVERRIDDGHWRALTNFLRERFAFFVTHKLSPAEMSSRAAVVAKPSMPGMWMSMKIRSND